MFALNVWVSFGLRFVDLFISTAIANLFSSFSFFILSWYTWPVIWVIARNLSLFWFPLLFAHLKGTGFPMCWVRSISMIFAFSASYALLPCWSPIQKQLSSPELIHTIRTMSNPWPPGSSSEQISCHDLPTLIRASSIATTKSESSSLGARQLMISDSRLLLAEEESDVLVDNRVPAQGNLECSFNLLFCFKTFSNMEDWVGHSLTHFSNVDPPDYNHCCFCDARFSSSSEITGWARRMKHVACHHRLDVKLTYARPDFELYTYLWNNRLITNAEYRGLKGNNEDRSRAARAYSPHPEFSEESSKIYIDTNSNSRTRRNRERQGREASSGWCS